MSPFGSSSSAEADRSSTAEKFWRSGGVRACSDLCANPEVALFERFTMTSRRAVAIANQETHRLGGNIIGDVELLLGLVKETGGLSHVALRRLGVELRELERQLEAQSRSL